MVRITIDDELKRKLLAADEVVELCDESGRLLGRVIPRCDDFIAGKESFTPPISEAELQRRLHSDEPGLTTEELKARLRELS